MRMYGILIALLLVSLGGTAWGADWGEVIMGCSDRMDVCLTMDAGGYEGGDRTDWCLDAIEARGIPVTTFMTGRMILNYPSQVTRMCNNGYEFGHHTIWHSDFTAKNADDSYYYSDAYLYDEELVHAESMIRDYYGGRTARPWFRFPYGSRDQHALDLIRSAGYRSVYWSVEAGDSNTPSVTGDIIKQKTYAGVRPGAIILLHWAGYHTYEVLGEVIDHIKSLGYNFVTLSELMTPGPTMGTVVDNDAPGFSQAGTWSLSSSVNERYDSNYRYASNFSGNTATWTATLAPGSYDVYAWWASGTDRCYNLKYQVTHSGGTLTTTVDQRTNGGKWNLLGRCSIDGPATVSLANTGASGTNMIADAVRFAPVITPGSLTPAWTFPTSGKIGAVYSSPSVWNWRAYLGSDDGYLYALDVHTGAQIWRTSIAAAIRTRPMYYSGYLYAATTGGDALCLSADTGRVVWRRSVSYGALSSPMPTGASVYTASTDGCIYQLNASNGQITAISPNLGSSINSSPSVPETNLVWVGCDDGKLYCLNGDLSAVRWSVASGKKEIRSSPVVSLNANILVTTSRSETLLMLNPGNGNAMCPVYTPDPPLSTDSVQIAGKSTSTPWVTASDNRAYFGTDRHVIWGVDLSSSLPATGWPLKMPGNGDFSSSPVVIPGPTGTPYLYIGCTDGKFYAVPTNDPIHYSTFDSGSAQFVASAAASGAGAGQILVAASTGGKVYGFPLK